MNQNVRHVLGFNDTSTLWVILCRLLEKGRREIEEIVNEMKRQGRRRKMNESEETEKVETFPPLFEPAAMVAGLAQLL